MGPTTSRGLASSGTSLAAFRPMGPTRDDMVLQGITRRSAGRSADACCASFDTLRREVDADAARWRAWTPSPSKRSGCSPRRGWPRRSTCRAKIRASSHRYGTGDPKIFIDDNGAPRVPQSLLMARRLIEAGARVVTLNYSKWDWHGGIRTTPSSIAKRKTFPIFDQCVSALIDDLHQRGLDQDCTVVVMGEFGRTPQDQRPESAAITGRRSTVALLAGRRHADRPGDRRDRPHRRRSASAGRSRSANCTRRSIATWASTRAAPRSPTSTAARNTWSRTTRSRCGN